MQSGLEVVSDHCSRPAITVSFLKAAECGIAFMKKTTGSRGFAIATGEAGSRGGTSRSVRECEGGIVRTGRLLLFSGVAEGT